MSVGFGATGRARPPLRERQIIDRRAATRLPGRNRLKCADSGRSREHHRPAQVDPERSAYGLAIGSALILAEDAGRLAIVTCPGRKR